MSKPRKHHQPVAQRIPKFFSVPMVADKFPDHAHFIYAAIYAFLANPAVESANNLTQRMCEISRGLVIASGGIPLSKLKDAHSRAVLGTILALEVFVQRYYRDAVLRVTEEDEKALKAGAGKLDIALRSIPAAYWPQALVDVANTLHTQNKKNRAKFAEAAAKCEAMAA
jgi:hypothetical protein